MFYDKYESKYTDGRINSIIKIKLIKGSDNVRRNNKEKY
jgi:hypothetical protein